MPTQTQNLVTALVALERDLLPRIKLYKINQAEESGTLPGAITTEPEDLRALAVLTGWASMLIKGEFKFVAMSPYGWGSGGTPAEAYKAHRKATSHITPATRRRLRVGAWLCHKDTKVFGDGSWEFPTGFTPVELEGQK